MRTPNFPYLTSTGGPGFLNAPPERPFARFVVDTAAAGEEAAGEGEERGAFSKAAAGRVAAAVRSALAGEERPPFDNDDGNGNVVFIEG